MLGFPSFFHELGYLLLNILLQLSYLGRRSNIILQRKAIDDLIYVLRLCYFYFLHSNSIVDQDFKFENGLLFDDSWRWVVVADLVENAGMRLVDVNVEDAAV